MHATRRGPLTVAVLLAFAATALAGNFPVGENFEGYATGQLEDSSDVGGNKGTGFADEWMVTDSMRPYVNVVAQSMSYDGGDFAILGGDQALSIGGAGVPGSTIDHTPRRQFNTQTGDVWYSFLLQPGANTTGEAASRDFFQVAFDEQPPRADSLTLSTIIDNQHDPSNDHYFGARAGGSGNANDMSSVKSLPGTTYLVVGHLVETSPGDYETSEIYINPTTLSAPSTPTATASFDIADPLTAIETVRCRISLFESGDEMLVDELRVGRSYLDVLAIYENKVRDAAPVAYWRFNDATGDVTYDTMGGLAANRAGTASLSAAGHLGAGDFPGFESNNSAAQFNGDGSRFEIADPGTDSILDFGNGDPITLEAWVRCDDIVSSSQVYILGKGRNASDDQNYGFRMAGTGSDQAELSFIYRNDADTAWGRWNSDGTIAIGDGAWHHLALTYTFGDGGSIIGYIDGVATTGSWDLGDGSEAPIQSDSPLWIGSSQGGNPNSTWNGLLDEIAIYDRILSPDEIRSHAVPEPVTLALLGLGCLGFAARRRKHTR